MRWRRVPPVQTVGALIVTGPDAATRVAASMAGKPALLQALPTEQGADWTAVFAGPAEGQGGEPDGWLLPRLPGATPLYQATPGWWLPVGIELAAPPHAHEPLWQALGRQNRLDGPVIALPVFSGGGDLADEVDLYPIRAPAPYNRAASAAPEAIRP